MGTGSPSRRGIRHFCGLCVTRVLFSKNVFVPKICFQFCRDRLYVCRSKLLTFRTLFLESFFWIAIQALLFILNGNFIFFLTRKTVFSKKTALSSIFFKISIDNLGSYMCYVIFIQKLLFVKYCLFLIDSLFLLLLMQQEHHYLFWDLLQFSLQKLYKYRFLLDALRTRAWIVLTAHLFVLGNLL